MNALQLALLALCSTSAGGLLGLRFRNHSHLALGFTAGALLGVVWFDLLPEMFELSNGNSRESALLALAIGFLLLHSIGMLNPASFVSGGAHARSPRLGVLSAMAMIAHSFIDGVGIGFAFHVSPAVGISVAIAVIAHDFCDGLSTVNLMLLHGNPTGRARAVLALNAIAPVLGAAAALLLRLPPGTFAVFLGSFAGFLLYIGASDVLPEMRSGAGAGKVASSIGSTVLGATCMFWVMRILG